WDPGDASDIVEGQDGADSLRFNGANISERFELSANGSRLRLTRDIATVTMDVDGVERVDLLQRGGSDVTTVDNLAGTDVSQVNVDEGGADGVADQVKVEGTEVNDAINVAGDAGGVAVTGLATIVDVLNPEGAADQLVVDGLAGDDAITASDLAAGA